MAFGGVLRAATVVLAAGGFVFGVYQYTAEQDLNRKAAEQRSRDETAAYEREFMKPWLESQRQIYVAALTAAARIANPVNDEDRESAKLTFWRLYHGKMIMVETKSVSSAMIAFGDCIGIQNACSLEELNERTRKLATAMADSMAVTAQKTYTEFASDQFKYR